MRTTLLSGALALGLLSLTSAVVISTQAAEAKKIQVMLVGTYHFSNPGKDLNNVDAVDVLTAARQMEIENVVKQLARFEPTRVAVEWPKEIVDERYAKYLAGTLETTRNEVVQFGFRLAKLRQLSRVEGLDVNGDFPFDPVMEWAKAHKREQEIERAMSAAQAEVAKVSALQRETTIGGVLRYLNSSDAIERNHAFYPAMLTMGAGAEQPGVALFVAWQKRNLEICARLLQSVRPGDRVVTFYGQGHIYLIRQCLREQPGVEVIDPQKFL